MIIERSVSVFMWASIGFPVASCDGDRRFRIKIPKIGRYFGAAWIIRRLGNALPIIIVDIRKTIEYETSQPGERTYNVREIRRI